MSAAIGGKQLAAMREQFLQEAEQAFVRMFGSDGQNDLVTFTEREDRACEVGDGLTRWLLERHVGQDASADPEEDVSCPLCGGEIHCDHPERVKLETREVLSRRGKVAFERAARRCPRCRRIFFPAG